VRQLQFAKEYPVMKWSTLKSSREPRRPNGAKPIDRRSGWVIVELGFWGVGIALIAIYFLASISLENQRSQGIELFSQARAAAMADEPASIQESPVAAPSPSPADTAAAASLPIAVLRIDRVGLEVPVFSDISELNLSRGAGWVPGTAAPNTGGNMAVAAHRDQYFRSLKDIQVGDILELESLDGRGEYRVSSLAIVDPDEVSVLDQTQVPTITLVTCYPFYFLGNAPQRYIVQAVAVDPPGKASNKAVPSTASQSGDK